MVSFREFLQAFREVGINSDQPVIVHASLSSVGEIRGGADTVLGALLAAARGVMSPTFTYKTMIIPEVGPQDNACAYGTGKDQNRLAEFFHPDMPADPMMGILPEIIRQHPGARRSMHPILSFSGIHVDAALAAQTLEIPLAPVGVLAEENGVVLLIGVNHTVNTSIHYGEKLAGRKQFTRWALTTKGIISCWGFPGCSQGFEAISPWLEEAVIRVQLGEALIQAIPLVNLMEAVGNLLKEEPLALLCERPDCGRCNAIRTSVANQ